MQESGSQTHSTAWVFQAWASLIIAISTTGIGIGYLPVNN